MSFVRFIGKISHSKERLFFIRVVFVHSNAFYFTYTQIWQRFSKKNEKRGKNGVEKKRRSKKKGCIEDVFGKVKGEKVKFEIDYS